MRLLLPALCEALARNGVRVAVDAQSRCIAVPVDRVTPAMFEGLKRYKLEIIRALRPLPLRTLSALHHCPRCGSDVVLALGDLCGTCASIAPRTVEIEPQSPAEIAYLHALANAEQLSPTVPEISKSPLGTVGTVGTVDIGKSLYARAQREKVKSL